MRRTGLLLTHLIAAGVVALGAAPPPAAALQLGVDVNGDGIVRVAGDGRNPRIPVDRSLPERPFLFWINGDQDDLDHYESWPLDRPDYETDGIDSLRDLEDFTRLIVFFDDDPARLAADTLRLSLIAREGDPAINLYPLADDRCSAAYLRDPEAGEIQRERADEAPPWVLRAGESVTVPLVEPWRAAMNGRARCFLFEGRAEGLGELQASLLRGSEVLDTAAPAWLSVREVKRLYQRINVPWPEDRRDVFDYTDAPPPPLALAWEVDPQGFPFEPTWYETDDVIVWVYGWLKSAPGLYEMSTVQSGETIFKRLWHRGYRGRLVFFHWPTIKRKIALGLGRSEYRGYKTGPVLMDHVHSYPPEKRVHVTAHSLGGVPLMAALAAGMETETVLFQASAVPAEAFDTRPELLLPDMADVETPLDPAHGGYRGYLSGTKTRIYNLYNTTDITFFGWNIAQKEGKQSAPWFKHYHYDPTAPEGQRFFLKQGPSVARPVTDPDEVRAMITRSRTHAIGAEPRVRGVVHESYDVNRPPFEFGQGHVVAWSWNPQKTTAFYNLVLDLFNIRYNSEHH